MFTITHLRKSWFSGVCSLLKFNLRKISDLMMYSLPMLWRKKKFFLCAPIKNTPLWIFVSYKTPKRDLSWFWSDMRRGRSMPNLVLFSKFAICSENFVMLLTNDAKHKNTVRQPHALGSLFDRKYSQWDNRFQLVTEAYLEPSRKSKMELFYKKMVKLHRRYLIGF